jgi:regulatory protein
VAFRKKESTTTATERAVRLLGRREHSARELGRKLRQRGHGAEETAAALDSLSRDHYQSDDRYAEALLRQRAAAGYGPAYIGAELQQNGIVRERIRELLDAEDWRQHLADYVERRYGSEPLDRAKATKLAAALVRRGFAPDQVFRLPQMRRGTPDV